LAEVLQVHVPGHELGVRVGDRHDRLAEVGFAHSGGAPEGAGAGGVAAVGGDAGTQFGHDAYSWVVPVGLGSGSRPPLARASRGRSLTWTAGRGSSVPPASTALTRDRLRAERSRKAVMSAQATRRVRRMPRATTVSESAV